MSMANKRRRTCTISDDDDGEPLPLDLLLEILARSDVRTVLRCAATSKTIRRVILGQDFHRRRRLALLRTDGFDPALLLGVSYMVNTAPVAFRGEHLRFDARLLRSHELVDSRDGFVVLQQREKIPFHDRLPPRCAVPIICDLRVCDSLTGETYRLPPPPAIGYGYPHALLLTHDDGGGGRSFQLLAADRGLRTQTFSSTDGRWGPVLETTHYASQYPYSAPVEHKDYTSRPIVLYGSGAAVHVHWLRLRSKECMYGSHAPHIVALDVGSAQLATRIDLPPECVSRMGWIQNATTGLQLATSSSPTGSLAVLVAEILVISMWTLEDSSTPAWIRQVVIKRQLIRKQPPGPRTHYIRFMGFGQRSGTVLLKTDSVGLVQLNLGSKDVVIIETDSFNLNCTQLCLHEINLSSLLQAMGQ
ncbi:hypothetical protein PR202_gb10763 [Eleusine coracana subsp. coracana]|uniref:F-box domain-containing protein n=1 Tax=Eleusine coracana subsp. coracana TaxID=191504 RepID=A0AAV5EKR3_ELECO|nr:hypothetical protein QOZ80_3BG0259180 [Eleusine coracana subsp. coracana]GJN23141.1 hypothetical protein PR202_gb10763 [Eleusine coracana subsp. coracana]